jgi:hypothetical protein
MNEPQSIFADNRVDSKRGKAALAEERRENPRKEMASPSLRIDARTKRAAFVKALQKGPGFLVVGQQRCQIDVSRNFTRACRFGAEKSALRHSAGNSGFPTLGSAADPPPAIGVPCPRKPLAGDHPAEFP